jgi:2-polyprenyl-3-methyl-5-hydroxy-6-metoxy-1,4-benzoquinol methylase
VPHERAEPETGTRASADNLAFYGTIDPGVRDYWRYMAAPRARMRVLASLLASSGARSIVDLGCGGGLLLHELHATLPNASLAGVDISAPQIAANRAESPEIAWLVANLDQPVTLPEPLRHTYDAVVASEILEHLDTPEMLLANATALARPGVGRLLLSTQSGPIRATERHVGHRRHFRARELRALLVQTGWQPLRVWSSGFPFHDLSKWLANLRPNAALARFTGRPYTRADRALCWLLRILFHLNSGRFGAQLFALAAAPDMGAGER